MGEDSTIFTSLIITTVALTWLAFGSCGVSLFSPAWITQTSTITVPGQSEDIQMELHMGLVVYCSTTNAAKSSALKDCTWFKETGKPIPDWLAATRALVGAATCVYFVAAGCSNVLFFKHLRNPECSSLLIASNFLGFGAIVSGVVVFGIGANKDDGVTMGRSGDLHFDWGYYIAIIAAGVALCIFLLTLVVISLITRKGQKHYTKMVDPNSKLHTSA